MANFFSINFSMINQDRFDAEYFKTEYQDNINLLKKTGKVLKLGSVFKSIKRGMQPEYDRTGEIKVLRSVNVGKLSFNNTRQEYVTESFLNSYQRGQVKYNDVLITSTGVGTLGRTSIWNSNEKAFCDGHITILRESDLNPYLVAIFLNTKYGLLQFDQNYRGSSGQIEIYPFDISKFIIPEILFTTQKEIGDMVQEAFFLEKESNRLFQEAKNILDSELNLDNRDLDILSNKYIVPFSEIAENNRFDSEYYNPKAKKIVSRIKELKHVTLGSNYEIKNGFPWKSEYFYEDNSGEPVVRIRDIKPTYIDNEKLTSLQVEYAKSVNFFKAQPKDIVIGMDGGKYFYASLIENECLVNQRVCHIIPCNSTISSEYVTFIINSEIGQVQLLRDMTIAGTVGHITNENIKKLIIPIFGDEVHTNITRLVRKSIDNKKESKELLKKAIEKVELIIQKASI